MKRHLKIALGEIGVKEYIGKKHNPRILQYFKEIGHSWVKDDEMAWCSAFANWVAKTSGLEYSGKLNARSWLTKGKAIEKPEKGDVVIFWRGHPKSWMGHVGFYMKEDSKYIYVLGGNQSNQVKVSAYPKRRLLGYRRLTSNQ